MKRNQIIPVISGVILLVAVLTNPDQDRHKEAIRSKLNAYMQKEMSDEADEWEQAGQFLGMMLGGSLIDGIISNIVTTNNYVVFSTTVVTWEGESKVIGIGVFGNVFLTNKLDDELEKGLLAQ